MKITNPKKEEIRNSKNTIRSEDKNLKFEKVSKLSGICFGLRIAEFPVKMRAFTLIELLVALTLLVILSAVIAPSFFSTMQKSKDQSAISRAALLDVAKTSFRSDKGNAYATTNWAAASDEQAKYVLIRDYLVSPPTYFGNGTVSGDYYCPKGYRYTLNALTNTTTVIRLSDNQTLASP